MRFALAVLMCLPLSVMAAPPPASPVVVVLTATDGRTLHADYYAPPPGGGPAVLLLHQLYTTRTSWNALIPHLKANGYAVLAPDLRGYGASRGPLSWEAAQEDTRLWLAWLRAQDGVYSDRIGTVGSSMGANLAVIGCADDNDAQPVGGCVTAVALSPGRNYFGYTPLEPALVGGLAAREVLFITSERDGYPARAVHELAPAYPQVTAHWLPGNAHGMDLLDAPTTAAVIGWLNTRLR